MPEIDKVTFLLARVDGENYWTLFLIATKEEKSLNKITQKKSILIKLHLWYIDTLQSISSVLNSFKNPHGAFHCPLIYNIVWIPMFIQRIPLIHDSSTTNRDKSIVWRPKTYWLTAIYVKYIPTTIPKIQKNLWLGIFKCFGTFGVQ